MIALVLAVVLVFLVLAAQYESWALPLAVILVVPMCLLCSIVAVLWAEMDVNIFTQVGFVVLVGLACKNAILVVEFARAQREAGKTRYEATLEACNLRLRPIVMTSFAFILGVRAAGGLGRGRGRNAPHAGHRRLRRHAGRHAVRHLSDARVLLRDRVVQRHAQVDARAALRRCRVGWRGSRPDDLRTLRSQAAKPCRRPRSRTSIPRDAPPA